MKLSAGLFPTYWTDAFPPSIAFHLISPKTNVAWLDFIPTQSFHFLWIQVYCLFYSDLHQHITWVGTVSTNTSWSCYTVHEAPSQLSFGLSKGTPFCCPSFSLAFPKNETPLTNSHNEMGKVNMGEGRLKVTLRCPPMQWKVLAEVCTRGKTHNTVTAQWCILLPL